MLVPTSDDEYKNYADVRTNLSLSKEDLLPLATKNTDGRSFALHPSMPGLQKRFNDGDAAFIANVGTLVEPTTIRSFNNGSVTLPRSLFSHNDQRHLIQVCFFCKT